MKRAVAEEGTELIEGIHNEGCPGGPMITIRRANGIVQEVPFDEDAMATPILIEAVILDLDIEDSKLREAVKMYCLNWLEEWVVEIVGNREDAYCIPLDFFWTKAEDFVAGYQAALVA
jgi:hypothetical protein